MMDLYWKVLTCGNPNKGWIVLSRSEQKVTKLISTKTARLIVDEHNRAIDYLESIIGKEQPDE